MSPARHGPDESGSDERVPDERGPGESGSGGSGPGEHRALRRRGTLPALYALLTLITLAPLALVRMPGLGDYPNNLARIYLEQHVASSAILQRFFDPAWQFVPYYGMDLSILGLAHLLPLEAAGRIYIAVCLLVPVLGVAAIRRAVWGRAGAVPLLAFVLSYNWLLARGLLNYLGTLGLALPLFALWIAAARRPARWHIAAFTAATTVIYLAHAFALITYCLLVAGFEMTRAWQTRPRRAAPIALRWAAAAATALPALALGLAFRGHLVIGNAVSTQYGSLTGRIGALLSPVLFPTTLATLTTLALLPLAVLLRPRGAAAHAAAPLIHPALGGTLLLASLASLLMPNVLFSLWGADFRLPLVAAIIGLAALRPFAAWPNTLPHPAIAAAIALVTLRAIAAAFLFRQADARATQIRQALAPLTPGARLLVVQDRPADTGLDMMTSHFGMLATMQRDAIIPYTFAYAAPLRLRPDAPIPASANAGPITAQQLRDGLAAWPANTKLPPYVLGGTQYWMGWPEHFDAVLFLHEAPLPADLPEFLHQLSATPYAALFQVLPRAPLRHASEQ